jgi:hypothetical protein
MEPSQKMVIDTRSLNELPLEPRPTILTTPLDIAAIKPLELWAFLENSDFVRRKEGSLYRQDEVRLIRHDEFLETDYQLLVEAGCVGVRDAAWWYVSHPAPGTFDWTWLDILSPDAPMHFADFARQITQRYPSLEYYCVCNEPSLLVEMGGKQGEWNPFLREENPSTFRRQISRMIIEASTQN